MSARFLFVAVQAGAERALKNEVAREQPSLKFAFSRPGFVTFRIPDGAAAGRREPLLDCVFARTWGHSLGKVAGGASDARLARDAWRLVADGLPNGASEIKHVHLWHRERALPGDEGYDSSQAELERAIGEALVAQFAGAPDTAPPFINAAAARQAARASRCSNAGSS